LARIGALFMQKQIEIHSARIATLGERAEDVFFVTRHDGQPLDDAQLDMLRIELDQALNDSATP
jgi:[protein-PII] uridylyltransferase